MDNQHRLVMEFSTVRTILKATPAVQKPRSIHDFSTKVAIPSMASFRNIYTSLMLVIARSTEKELASQVSYLKAENQILRSVYRIVLV